MHSPSKTPTKVVQISLESVQNYCIAGRVSSATKALKYPGIVSNHLIKFIGACGYACARARVCVCVCVSQCVCVCVHARVWVCFVV